MARGTDVSDLLNPHALQLEIEEGYVRERQHPTKPHLSILNYTEKAQYENHWNDVTRLCRGLIADNITGQVVARPFSKFLNYGQHAEGSLLLDAEVSVTDKADGSLGILYHDGDDWAIATRGSFDSEQARHATVLVRERYRTYLDRLGRGVTRLFEIVYPGNRIVLDYGKLDDLILLGGVSIHSGRVYGPIDPFWTGPAVEEFPAATLAEALAMPPRPNAEGVVVRFEETGLMVKIKQEDYVRLHKIVTGMSERGVWEHLAANQGTSITGLLEVVPDEWHGWLRDVSGALLDQFDELQGRAWAAWHHTTYDLGFVHGEEGWSRKEFAQSARNYYPDLAPLLFRLLDGRPLDDAIWKRLKPVGHRPMTNKTEDVA